MTTVWRLVLSVLLLFVGNFGFSLQTLGYNLPDVQSQIVAITTSSPIPLHYNGISASCVSIVSNCSMGVFLAQAIY